MNKILRLGVIGANPARGWARDAHFPALANFSDVKISAVSARTLEIAEDAAAVFGAGLAFDDSIALTTSPEVDIVVVTVKVPEHRAVVLSALAAGKHVYCEWPLGRDLDEAREMAAAARTAGVRFAIGLQALASPAIRKAVELVRSGEIGQLQTLRVFSPTAGWGSAMPTFYAYLNDKRNGATLATIAGGHTLAAVTRLVGNYTELAAQSSTMFPAVRNMDTGKIIERSCADHVRISGRHDSGCSSEIEVIGGQAPGTLFKLELQASKGNISITGDEPGGFQAGKLQLHLNGEPVSTPGSFPVGLGGPPTNVAEVYWQFFSDIRSGGNSAPGIEDALNLTMLLDAIDQAAESN